MRITFLAAILAAVSLFSVASFSQTATSDVVSKAHATTYHIGQETAVEGDSCSATAVGPHALLTATHCELGSDDLAIEGQEKTAHIDGRIRDGNDHTIFLLSGVTFKVYAQIDLKNSISQGDDVFLFGNPGNWSDVYRRGYMAGIHQDLLGSESETLFDVAGWHGDSGAAIFDSRGEIAAVLTGLLSSSNAEGSLKLPFSFQFGIQTVRRGCGTRMGRR